MNAIDLFMFSMFCLILGTQNVAPGLRGTAIFAGYGFGIAGIVVGVFT